MGRPQLILITFVIVLSAGFNPPVAGGLLCCPRIDGLSWIVGDIGTRPGRVILDGYSLGDYTVIAAQLIKPDGTEKVGSSEPPPQTDRSWGYWLMLAGNAVMLLALVFAILSRRAIRRQSE